MKTAILIIALSTMAYAGDLYVYQRDPSKMSTVNHGLAIGANKVPVLIRIYGRDSIDDARQFGRGTADANIPFGAASQRIRSRAAELYHGHEQLVRWFEQDASAGYDAEMRRLGAR